jgi:hypothetical protein
LGGVWVRELGLAGAGCCAGSRENESPGSLGVDGSEAAFGAGARSLFAALRRHSREEEGSAGLAMVARWMRVWRACGTASHWMSSSRSLERARIMAKRSRAHSELAQA